MVLIKRKVSKVNEESTENVNITISDPELVQLQSLAQQKKANAKKQWDQACQEYENTLAQLLAKQAVINKQNAKKEVVTTTNTSSGNTQVNEGVNTKHVVIGEIIDKVLNSIEVSYSLNEKEIQRIARKINDYFNEHKSDFKISEFRVMIKKYFLGHSSINFSQSEINEFNDAFIDEISKDKYTQFSELFS